jgi:hypothetical protein
MVYLQNYFNCSTFYTQTMFKIWLNCSVLIVVAASKKCCSCYGCHHVRVFSDPTPCTHDMFRRVHNMYPHTIIYFVSCTLDLCSPYVASEMTNSNLFQKFPKNPKYSKKAKKFQKKTKFAKKAKFC